MRLNQIDIPKLTRIEIEPLEIVISGEEILADLLYPAPGAERPAR